MRNDMFKVIVERPRWGAGHAQSPKLKRIKNPETKHIGLKRHALTGARYSKSLNENLAPMVRFIRSRCGQRWDNVFSEICQNLDTSSTVKMHVRLHIEDFVMTKISMGRYGEWIWNGRVITPQKGRHVCIQTFFVDPTDGILKGIEELAAALSAQNKADQGGTA